MYKLTSPITGGVMTIDTREDGNGGAVATANGTPGTGTATFDMEQPFSTLEAADLFAETLRTALIAAGLQEA